MCWDDQIPDEAEALANIDRAARSWDEGTWAVFRIADAETDEVIGGVNLKLGEHDTESS